MATGKRAGLIVTTPSAREIVLERTFDAPRRLVFDALTRPELLKRWYGPPGWSLIECEIDLRVGGTWRFVSRGPDGARMGQRGVYREIVRPERLVYTEWFDDWDDDPALAEDPPDASLVTAVLIERGGTTTLTSTVRYASQAIRDRVINSGMEGGVTQSYDRLAGVLASIL